MSEANIVQIDVVHQKIHSGNFYDYQKVSEDLADGAILLTSLRANTKDLHVIITIDAEGKSRLKSYVNTTWSDDGSAGSIFNRFIDDAPITTANVYYGGTVSILGTLRFDKLLLGGTGPRSTGATSGQRVESVLSQGNELTISIENVSGSAKDVGVTIEWYEE